MLAESDRDMGFLAGVLTADRLHGILECLAAYLGHRVEAGRRAGRIFSGAQRDRG